MDVKFSIDPETGSYFLDAAEFRAFRRSKYDSGSAGVDVSSHTLACKNYLTWFVLYADNALKGKSYADAQLVDQLFLSGTVSKTHFKEYLRSYLYAAKVFVDLLLAKINEDNIARYNHLLAELDTDLEWLIVHCECIVLKKVDKATLQSGRRANLSPRDIYWAANALFRIEEYEKVEELYLSDLKPVVMFQIRQMLELFGRNLLGYEEIVDASGNPVKKFTQIAWEFIGQECRKPDSRIEVPFQVAHIQKINSWSNNFVHTSYIFSSIIQQFALQYLSILFKGSGERIRVYDGHYKSKFNIADIKIIRYDSLKRDFEAFLQAKKPDIQVSWMEPHHVGAYIISYKNISHYKTNSLSRFQNVIHQSFCYPWEQ